MRLRTIQRILGLLLALFSITLLPSTVISWWTQDGALRPFLLAFAMTLGTGLLLWLPVYKVRQELRLRDGFMVVVLFWTALSLSGAVPLMLADHPHMHLADALFESMSGLTTTGATVLTGIDDLPRSILFYRQQLQWMGGMGIIVLAVAILPMLGIGGMQLYRAETPGPMKDAKLTPRIAETAKALWYIYLGMTIACALGYWLAGMTAFDAIGHSFATVSTGGFSTHDLSIGYFNSRTIEAIATFFAFFAGVNFSLHYLGWRGLSLKTYFRDAEFRTYLTIIAGTSLVTITYLVWTGTYSLDFAVRHGIFQTVTIATSTGFGTTSFAAWPGFIPVLLLFASFIGGCAGSTGGGIKVIRVLLLYRQGKREIRRLIHPNAIIPIKIGGRPVPDRIIDAVWGFFATYVVVFAALMLGVMATGLDQVTAFSAVAACINNLGPGLGAVSADYGSLSDTAKYLLTLAMLLGRLEIFTLLVLLSPAYWRS